MTVSTTILMTSTSLSAHSVDTEAGTDNTLDLTQMDRTLAAQRICQLHGIGTAQDRYALKRAQEYAAYAEREAKRQEKQKHALGTLERKRRGSGKATAMQAAQQASTSSYDNGVTNPNLEQVYGDWARTTKPHPIEGSIDPPEYIGLGDMPYEEPDIIPIEGITHITVVDDYVPVPHPSRKARTRKQPLSLPSGRLDP